MKRTLTITVAALLLVFLVTYMFTYTVRYNEAAIVTTFGSTGEGSVKNAPSVDADGLTVAGDDAGLHFKWPWPIQQVAQTYDTRVQVVEGALEQAQTADQQSVNIRFYVTWRIADPLEFYKSVGQPASAEQTLRSRVRSFPNFIGQYRLDQLVNADSGTLRLDEIGQRMRGELQAGVDPLGIRVEEVGVISLTLPGPVTNSVFGRMAAERTTLAASARNEGQAEYARLTSEASASAGIIESFARRQANELRNEGQQRAAQLQTRFADNEELASFLAARDVFETLARDRARFIIDGDRLYPFSMLREFLPRNDEADGDDGGSQPPPASE